MLWFEGRTGQLARRPSMCRSAKLRPRLLPVTSATLPERPKSTGVSGEGGPSYEYCFSLQLMQTLVQGTALRRAFEISSSHACAKIILRPWE